MVALFGLLGSSVAYAMDVGSSPFETVSGSDQVTISEIIPDLPVIVSPDPDPEPDPKSDPEPIQEEQGDEQIIEDPSGSESENTISQNTVSNDDVVDPDLEEPSSDNEQADPIGSDRSPLIVNINDVNADNFYKYSLSADTIMISQLDSISQDLVSINEVLKKHEKTQKDFIAELSRINRNEQSYQKGVLEYLLSIADSLSGNKIKISADEIRLSLSDYERFFEVSENMISDNGINETVSGPDPDPETVSDDDIKTISDDVVSISKGDLDQLHKDNEQLHNDLKSIFYVGIFGVIFLAMIAAGNLEQIIFKRIRG